MDDFTEALKDSVGEFWECAGWMSELMLAVFPNECRQRMFHKDGSPMGPRVPIRPGPPGVMSATCFIVTD